MLLTNKSALNFSCWVLIQFVTLQNISRLQSETAELTKCHIDIIFTGHIILATDKSIAIGMTSRIPAGFRYRCPVPWDTDSPHMPHYWDWKYVLWCRLRSARLRSPHSPHDNCDPVCNSSPVSTGRSDLPAFAVLRFWRSLCRRLLLLLCCFSLFLSFQPLILRQHSFYHQFCLFSS